MLSQLYIACKLWKIVVTGLMKHFFLIRRHFFPIEIPINVSVISKIQTSVGEDRPYQITYHMVVVVEEGLDGHNVVWFTSIGDSFSSV